MLEVKAQADEFNIILTGFVPDESLRALYGACLLVWFPSLYEGFGLPVIEAMACGAPVVTSNSTALPEVAGSAALLVTATSFTENVEAVCELLDDSRRRSAFAELGRNRG